MITLWLTAGVLGQAGEAPPVTVQSGAHPGFRRYQRRYTEVDLDLERDLDRVIEAARRPASRKARKAQAARVAKPLKELLATAKRADAAPLAISDLRSLAKAPEMHAASPAEWRAAVVMAAMQARAELQARRALDDEDDIETLLLMAA